MRNRKKIPAILAPLAQSKGSAGFTMVEMMVALLIFGIAIVGLVQAIPNGMHTREKSRRLSVATFLAKEQVEALRSVAFNDPDLAAGTHADPGNPIRPGFRRTWTVEDGVPMNGMKRLTVRVSFASTTADSQAVLITQLAE